eukprot:1097195-Pelagomonas_calceolata.AAC.3
MPGSAKQWPAEPDVRCHQQASLLLLLLAVAAAAAAHYCCDGGGGEGRQPRGECSAAGAAALPMAGMREGPVHTKGHEVGIVRQAYYRALQGACEGHCEGHCESGIPGYEGL